MVRAVEKAIKMHAESGINVILKVLMDSKTYVDSNEENNRRYPHILEREKAVTKFRARVSVLANELEGLDE